MHFRLNVLLVATLSLPIYCSTGFAQDDGATWREHVVARFNPDDFVALDAYPGSQFADIPVETASGAWIGTVRIIGLAPDGSASRVLVGLYSGGSVWILADALRYNRNARILLTNLKHVEPSADQKAF